MVKGHSQSVPDDIGNGKHSKRKSSKTFLKKILKTKQSHDNLSQSHKTRTKNHKRSNTDHTSYRSKSVDVINFSSSLNDIFSLSYDLCDENPKSSSGKNDSNDSSTSNLDGHILYDSISAIVRSVTDPNNAVDQNVIKTFLITYRTFVCPIELLDLLEDRLYSKENGLDNSVFSIRLCVYNFIKTWVESYYYDFEDESCILKLKSILKLMSEHGMVNATKTIEGIVSKRVKDISTGVYNFVDPDFPVPIYPTNYNSIRDIHPKEFARQLSIIEYDLFRSIKPFELLDVNWTKKDKEAKSPNVLKMINFSNHVVKFIINEVLLEDDFRARALTINRLIYIAKYLVEMNNLNGAMEILSSLRNSSLFRLKKTWKLIPKESWMIFEEIDELFNPEANFKNYRNYVTTICPPCIAYLGRHLSDLLFLDEKYPKIVEGKMNFSKMEATSNIISFLISMHHIPYHFIPLDKVIRYVRNGKEINEKDGYIRSLALEAR